MANVLLETSFAQVSTLSTACKRLRTLNVNPVDAYLLRQYFLPPSYHKQRHEDDMNQGMASLVAFGFSMPENAAKMSKESNDRMS
jgi:hypothetical protein